MNTYEVFLRDGSITTVRAESWELIQSKEFKFYKTTDKKEILTVALFNFENICGVVRVAEA